MGYLPPPLQRFPDHAELDQLKAYVPPGLIWSLKEYLKLQTIGDVRRTPDAAILDLPNWGKIRLAKFREVIR
jgi:hypothetical protein